MRRLRIQCTILIILACLSIISVGFASWVTTDDSNFNITGSIVVDDVRTQNRYLVCNESDIVVFNFFKTGFVNTDGTISDTGQIYVPFTVNINNCKEEFADNSKLEITINFTTINMDIFVEDPLNLSIVLKDTNDNIIKTIDKTKDGLLSFEIDNLIEIVNNVEYRLYYQFKINEVNKTFIEDVYPVLLQEDFSFNIMAKITGSN